VREPDVVPLRQRRFLKVIGVDDGFSDESLA
jgi:hypothetical protein